MKKRTVVYNYTYIVKIVFEDHISNEIGKAYVRCCSPLTILKNALKRTDLVGKEWTSISIVNLKRIK